MKGIMFIKNSDKPIYQQLYDQISSQILKNEIKGGVNLPSIRSAAKDLRVSIITVKKTWEELERNGFIYTVAGKGCFVNEITKKSLEKKKMDIIKEQLKKDLTYYQELEVSKIEFLKLVEKLYNK